MDDRESLVDAIQEALEHAVRRSFPHGADVKVEINSNNFRVDVFQVRTVVEMVEAPVNEIDLEAAQVYYADAKLGDKIMIKADLPDFRHIAMRIVRKTIIERLGNAERLRNAEN